jgi:AsmA protein
LPKTGPDTDIQNFAATVHMAPEGFTLSDIQLLAPALGALTGRGTVSPTQDLDFKMSAALHTSGVAGVLRDAPIPFLVQGTASNPVFKPEMEAYAFEQIKELGKAASEVRGLFRKRSDRAK